MMTAFLLIGIIIVSGLARLYTSRKYDVSETKQAVNDALDRNYKARVRNIHVAIKK